MTNEESESKFDNLVSAEYMSLGNHLLHRVPSVKNMQHLSTLDLVYNKITRIAPGDFKGAISMVLLNLGGNSIVSVALSAFTNLAAFRVRPEDFNPTNADGTPFTNANGLGTFPSCQQHTLDSGTVCEYTQTSFTNDKSSF